MAVELASGPVSTPLDYIDLIESELSDAGFNIIDDLGGVERNTRCFADFGVAVEVPATINTDQLRDRDCEWDQDTTTVTLLVQLTDAQGQKSKRAEAFEKETLIHQLVTALRIGPERTWNPSHRGTTRDLHPLSDGWWQVIMTFQMERYAAVGGGS